MPEGQTCPSCRAACEPDAVVCVRCGTDLKSGRRMDIRVYVNRGASADDTGEAPYGWFVTALAEYVPGLFRPLVFALSLALCVLALALAGVTLFLFFGMGVVFEALITGAVGLMAYGTGLAWMLTGELGLLTSCLMEFDGKRWMIFAVLILAPVLLIFTAMCFVIPTG